MERLMIQLTPEQARRVKQAAAALGMSMARYIREAVDVRLGDEAASDARARAIDSIGGFRSDRSDVSRRHDDLLADAYSG
jgi:hypothetical protein